MSRTARPGAHATASASELGISSPVLAGAMQNSKQGGTVHTPSHSLPSQRAGYNSLSSEEGDAVVDPKDYPHVHS